MMCSTCRGPSLRSVLIWVSVRCSFLFSSTFICCSMASLIGTCLLSPKFEIVSKLRTVDMHLVTFRYVVLVIGLTFLMANK